ncbi:MAG: InlB B-repeat-containing protein, partial [Treponema sp.]|nr:InlB B-repeat-containing protein [Treponema sp.]
MNNRGQGAARLVVFFCAGLLLFTGCKDLFHPDEQETDHTVDHTVYYTVTFDANWGSPEIQTRTVQSGSTVGYSNMPSEPTMSGYTFDGWYRLDWNGDEPQATLFTAFTPVYGNIIVYASWMAVQMSSNLSLNDALTWISNNAVTGDTYTITLWNNETIAPKSLSYSGKTVSITLTGGTTEWTVNLSTIGSLFTVGSGVTLTLGNNVTLWGRNDNTASLVTVNSGGNLVMESGSKITRNTGRSTQTGYGVDGGGVHIESGGIFTMNGGIINNNFVAGDGGG